MSIPKKGSRVIVVDDKSYRYLVKVGNIGDHKDQRKLILTIQENEEYPDKIYQQHCFYDSSIKPSDVCKIIRQAIKNGWNPSLTFNCPD